MLNLRLGPCPQKGGYSVLLSGPDAYWNATPEQLERICNGCGTKGIGSIVPDYIYGVCITDACDIHDACYEIGETAEDKDSADRAFLNNILRLVETAPSSHWKLLGPILVMLRRRRALKYYEAVAMLGGPAFWK